MGIFVLISWRKRKCASVILRRVILHLIVWRFSHKGRVVEKRKPQGLDLFAFSVSGFQREKVSSDLSHMHCRYTGRSGVKGRDFNNIAFSPIWHSVSPESSRRERRWHLTCGARRTNTGVHRSLEIQMGKRRWSSREAWSDQLRGRWLVL